MIEQYKAKRLLKRPLKRRGLNVTEGQTLYAVRKGTLYFIWSYVDKAFAEQMDAKLTGPVDMADEQANWRRTVGELTPSGRTHFGDGPKKTARVAYWTNKLGEDMSSTVHAEFTHGDSEFVVVHDWRAGAHEHGFVVLEITGKDVMVRTETPR